MFTMQRTPSSQAPDDLTQSNDEPPEQIRNTTSPPADQSPFFKFVAARNPFNRRESLLTRQLHASEGESHDESHSESRPAGRALSNSSVAELTSDNDLTSPGTRCSTPSPPLPPTRVAFSVPSLDKHVLSEPIIMEHEETQKPRTDVDKATADFLSRRRCITFACGNKGKDTEASKAAEKKIEPTVVEPPKRKCALTFVCPTRNKPNPSKLSPINTRTTRHMSPAPRLPRSPRSVTKVHRNSDATVTHLSPGALRKVPSVLKRRKAKYADALDEENRDAKRYHEFASNAKADDEWTEMSTVHRNKLTVRDTLQKENVIRQMGQEVEDEVADEEDEEAILDELDAEEDLDNDDDEEDEEEEDEEEGDDQQRLGLVMAQAGGYESDRGFSTDDEEGFANSSESDGEGSDYEWWAPGRSTAATSTDQMEMIRPTQQRRMSDSSLESAREANGIVLRRHKKTKGKTAAVKIDRPPTPELPDSTDFVCGTLDEDRPLEQAYLACIKQREAAKHRATPQDIDPTFPTSDPEMDEEDEVDEKETEADEDDHQLFMHGKMEIQEDSARRGRDKGLQKKRSPHQSPRRLRSPPPPLRTAHRSPPPPTGRRTSLRSPPPPANRGRCRSPPPKRLFGHSPHRMRSPPPSGRPTSPPNSARSSVQGTPTAILTGRTSGGLGSRPALTHTASLPRVPTMTKVSAIAATDSDDEDEKEDAGSDRRHRGAIDIVKGLEKKRQRRKEKLYQKHCQKAKKEVEKRCKPGKGAERMRELGLELAAYRGKTAEHILSI